MTTAHEVEPLRTRGPAPVRDRRLLPLRHRRRPHRPVAGRRSPVAGVRRPKVADDSQTTGLDRDQLRAVLALARQRAAAGAGGGPLPGEGEHGPELVTVEPGGLAVVSDFGPAHAGDRRPATGDRSMRSSLSLIHISEPTRLLS